MYRDSSSSTRKTDQLSIRCNEIISRINMSYPRLTFFYIIWSGATPLYTITLSRSSAWFPLLDGHVKSTRWYTCRSRINFVQVLYECNCCIQLAAEAPFILLSFCYLLRHEGSLWALQWNGFWTDFLYFT